MKIPAKNLLGSGGRRRCAAEGPDPSLRLNCLHANRKRQSLFTRFWTDE